MQVELWSDGKGMTGEWARFLYEQRAAVSLPREALGGKAVTRLKEAGYGRAEGPGIAVRLMMGPENIDELPEQWRQVRADGMEPRLQILGAGERKGQAVGGVTAERIEKVLEELARRGAEEFGQLWSVPASAARACKRHLYACHVAACGTVYACAGVGIPLGNVRATTFKEILELSEVLENLRDFRHRVKEPCRSCCQTTDCYGCRGAAYEATGDYLAGDGLCGRARAVEIPALPVEAGGMIPHGPTMRVVGRLIEVGERRGVMEYVVAADSPMVDGAGRLDECACIEMIAQTFAAAHGFHLAAGAAPQGLLLGVRNLAIEGTARVGDRLLVEVRKQMRFGDFSIVEGAVRHADGRQMASGEIKLWGPAEDESAAKG
jgi:predicted hotdog family 3-hydroxylacyl-ACP dehydratase